MDIFDLAVQKREEQGTRPARSMRREGFVPAILYGHGMEPVSLKLSQSDLLHALHTRAGENVILNLKVEGLNLKESTCIIKDLQHHPVTGHLIHADFTIISMREKIEVNVPLHVRNVEEAAGVKEGGVLDIVHHEIRVECLPIEIPENFQVDIKALKIGDAVHLKDLGIPASIKCLLDPEEVVVTVHPPAKEEEKPEEGEELTQPEVIEKGKKEDLEEGAEPEKPAKKAPEAKKSEGS